MTDAATETKDTPGESKALLVADDDPDILGLVCLQLGRLGFETVRATDGQEALEKARELQPPLCVLDVMMPKLTGIEVVERMRADERTASIPVLLLTATVQEQTVAAGLELGANAYLRKPFKSDELEATVKRLLAER